MILTKAQVSDLFNRMSDEDVEEIDVTEGSDGKITFWILEKKIYRRPFPLKKRNGKKNGD
jgi:hypothetical protein